MFERFMRWLGYVPTWRYVDELNFARTLRNVAESRLAELNRLRQYAHVREIESNIEAGKARKK